ncbi:hypothetical protein [uncultured Mediterranean phage uvDeep-CGR0-AD1-C123]|nr:hypothetical protein [uncultured Mediterranean phage uvDeep-CGR0-AD1-C123]
MYLSGKVVADPRIGTLLSFGGGERQHGHQVWAADNGCFARPDTYSDDGFLRWLDRLDRTGCLFAVAPDVLADGAATLARATPVLPLIRNLGYPAAFVGQDGQRGDRVPWDEIDALFIGGTTEWKLSGIAADLIHEAKQRGKWVHMGRVNSWQRIHAAACLGVDSVDGTHLAFRPDRYTPEVIDWLDRIQEQPSFCFESGATRN